MKTMPRILFLLFSLSVMTMIFITKCGLNMDYGFIVEDSTAPQDGKTMKELFQMFLKQNEMTRRNEVDILQSRIEVLEKALVAAEEKLKNYTRDIPEKKTENVTLNIGGNRFAMDINSTDFNSFFLNKIESAEIFEGLEFKSEYEIVSYSKFTTNRIFPAELGLGKRVVEKPIGLKKKDFTEVIDFAVRELNRKCNVTENNCPYVTDDFIDGIYRTEPTTGMHYELYFRNSKTLKPRKYAKLIILRPFGPLISVQNEVVNTNTNWVNLILPLSGRTAAFKQFMSRFVQVCILIDQKVFLTVVYFGTEGIKDVKAIMYSAAKKTGYKHMKLLTVNETFSRGRGLQVGASNWKRGDALLFFCDVDIVFKSEFLDKCRMNSMKAKKVYYPIVFSLYNPNMVYTLQDVPIPPEKDQLIIAKEYGFWRDFGYGMTCQYRSDFLRLNGFDEAFTGWGGEDVFLYQKYVRSDIIVIRSTDPTIFHLWHEKVCDLNLTIDQYRSCIQSRALNEASHAQLGFLAFKKDIDLRKSMLPVTRYWS